MEFYFPLTLQNSLPQPRTVANQIKTTTLRMNVLSSTKLPEITQTTFHQLA